MPNQELNKTRGSRSEREGLVVSDKMEKTVIVRVDRTFRDPRYQKVITRGRKYNAHDESNALKIGDKVLIKESKPYSKTKRWLVVKKIEGNQ